MSFLLKHNTPPLYLFPNKQTIKRKVITMDRVMLGHGLNILLLLSSIMYFLYSEQSIYAWRMIEVVRAPLNCGCQDDDQSYCVFPRTGYGEVNIVGDREGVFYYHTRVSPLIPKGSCVQDIESGLTEECLIRTDLQSLTYLIRSHQKKIGEMELICTISLTKRAGYKELIQLFDLMFYLHVKKFLWRDPTKEELAAIPPISPVSDPAHP